MNQDGGNRRSRGLWGLRIAVLIVILGVVGLGIDLKELRSTPEAFATTPSRLQGFGHALDALTGLPVSGATVTVDGSSSTSGLDGMYQLSGLSSGEKIAVVTHSSSVPTAFHFSVYAHGNTSTSVHTPPAYLVPKQPEIVVPAGGGSVTHGMHVLTFQGNLQPVTVRLTGFGEHPGTPAPPVAIPAAGSPQPPRPPVIPPASSDEQAFPQSIFHIELSSNSTGSAVVPLAVAGADPPGTKLPLLRFDTATALWKRAGDFLADGGGFATGTIGRSGLYMVVTTGRILSSQVSPTGETTDVVSPYEDSSVSFTVPSVFEIDNATSSDVRPAVFWIYGWREGNGNLTGVRVDFASQTASSTVTAAVAATDAEVGTEKDVSEVEPVPDNNPCPPGFTCPEGTTPCIVPATTVNGCGSKTSFGGVCTCCPEGTACQAEVKVGSAIDTYDISLGLEEIIRQIKAKGEKRKSDISVTAGCFSVAQQ